MLKHIFGILLGVVFGSSQLMAAATCNDSAVVDEFLEKYICSNILVCSVFGIKNYKELKSLSNEEITSRYNNSAVAKQLNELKKIFLPHGILQITRTN